MSADIKYQTKMFPSHQMWPLQIFKVKNKHKLSKHSHWGVQILDLGPESQIWKSESWNVCPQILKPWLDSNIPKIMLWSPKFSGLSTDWTATVLKLCSGVQNLVAWAPFFLLNSNVLRTATLRLRPSNLGLRPSNLGLRPSNLGLRIFFKSQLFSWPCWGRWLHHASPQKLKK